MENVSIIMIIALFISSLDENNLRVKGLTVFKMSYNSKTYIVENFKRMLVL